MQLINCEVSLNSTCHKDCVITYKTERAAQGDNLANNVSTGAIFVVTDTKLYIILVILSH